VAPQARVGSRGEAAVSAQGGLPCRHWKMADARNRRATGGLPLRFNSGSTTGQRPIKAFPLLQGPRYLLPARIAARVAAAPAQPTIPGHTPARRCSRRMQRRSALAWAGEAAQGRRAGEAGGLQDIKPGLEHRGQLGIGQQRPTPRGSGGPICSLSRARCRARPSGQQRRSDRETSPAIAGSGLPIEPLEPSTLDRFHQAGPASCGWQVSHYASIDSSGRVAGAGGVVHTERSDWFHLWRPRCSGSSV